MNERFSTGPQLRPANANRLLVLIQNTNSTPVTITVRLRDLENSNNTVSKQVTIGRNSTDVITFPNIPRVFALVLIDVPSGVYFTATLVRGHDNAFNIIENFMYNDFIQISNNSNITDTLD